MGTATLKLESEWFEDDGCCLWFRVDDGQVTGDTYYGSPLDIGWNYAVSDWDSMVWLECKELNWEEVLIRDKE